MVTHYVILLDLQLWNKKMQLHENYLSESILPNLSEIYERITYNQIYPYFNILWSNKQCWQIFLDHSTLSSIAN